MRTASSASRTWRAWASASEYTAIVRTPRRRARAEDAAGDLAAIGDQQALEHGASYMRNTPKRVASSARCAPPQGPAPARVVCRRIDDAVVPQPGRRVVRVALAFVLRADGPLKASSSAPSSSRRALELLALDGGEHARRLLPAHDGDARVRPLEQEAWRVRAAAHGVVAGAVAAADDDGELRHRSRRRPRSRAWRRPWRCRRPLRASDHEAGDVLQEQQRYPLARAQFDEVRALQRASENRMPLLARMPTG